MSDQPPHRSYITLLKHLVETGKGLGRVNIHGQLEAGPVKDKLPGDAAAWLMLCAWGCLDAVQDRPGWLEISPLGRHYVEGGK